MATIILLTCTAFQDQVGDYGVNNLELYSFPNGWTDVSQAGDVISVATDQNLEQIFAKVPANGDI